MPEGVEEVPTIGIIYPPPEVRSILYRITLTVKYQLHNLHINKCFIPQQNKLLLTIFLLKI